MLFLFNVKMRWKLLSWEAREGHRHSLSLKARGVAPPKPLNLKMVSKQWNRRALFQSHCFSIAQFMSGP